MHSWMAGAFQSLYRYAEEFYNEKETGPEGLGNTYNSSSHNIYFVFHSNNLTFISRYCIIYKVKSMTLYIKIKYSIVQMLC